MVFTNMISIRLLILFISMKNILTIGNNSSIDRRLILSSCQQDGLGLATIFKPIDRRHFFYFSNQPSLSLSSFSSSLHLSYCEHQQTTYYLPSGFSILRSSPRLPFTDIADKENSSSFHRHHNTILSASDQSTSSNSNMITTLMLLSSSITTTTVQEKHLVIDKDNNLHLTTISNNSLSHTSLATTLQNGQRTFYILLLSGCGAAGLLILLTIYTIIKYYNRDEGSYKIDESKNFTAETHLERADNSGRSGKTTTTKPHRQKLLTPHEQTLTNTKEWYV